MELTVGHGGGGGVKLSVCIMRLTVCVGLKDGAADVGLRATCKGSAVFRCPTGWGVHTPTEFHGNTPALCVWRREWS